MATPTTEHEQSPELREILNKVRKAKERSESNRSAFLPRWREWYGLHRNYRRFARDHSSATSERDRDEVIREAQREFGAELFIPYVYGVIETVTPRLLMNNPRMKVKPRPGLEPARAEAVQELFHERQSEIDYSLKLIPSARRGLKYGLGVGKTFWAVKGRNRPVIERGLFGRPVRKERFVVASQGPDIEDVELEDFFWDPAAKNMETCRYAIHRTWRDLDYVRERVETGDWEAIDLEAVESMGSEEARQEMLSERAAAAGLEGYNAGEGKLHEVWEYHDGEHIYTVLDKKFVVQNKPSPFTHRELPFQIFRPTLQEGEFVGIGEIEPIVHLQYELNTLRSQRRDNATMTLQKAFIYAEGAVDPADLVIGPGKGISVYGNPGEVIMPLQFPEIPASGYQEEAAIKADLEFANGMADTVAGAGGSANASAETATGIQLVQAAANVRVEMKTKLLHAEYIKPCASQWLELYRQHILSEPATVTVEGPSGWEHLQVEAEDLQNVRAILPEEDSTQPENSPQKRNDALALYNQTRGNDVIDPRKAAKQLLKSFDIADAEEWILPDQMAMNPQVAEVVGMSLRDTLIQGGMDEEQAQTVALATMEAVMQATGVSQPIGEPSGNGGAPAPEPQEA